MKTLLVTKSNIVVGIQPETLDTFVPQSCREAISRIYKIEEDCKVKYGDVVEDAKAGQILIVFYEGYFPNKFVLASSEKWIENIDAYNKKVEEAKKKDDEGTCECDECDRAE